MKKGETLARYRLGVALRVAAAVAGSYAIAALVAIAGARALPLSREEAATAATMASLLVMPVAAMGCFWARSPARACAGILGFALLFGGIAMITGWRP